MEQRPRGAERNKASATWVRVRFRALTMPFAHNVCNARMLLLVELVEGARYAIRRDALDNARRATTSRWPQEFRQRQRDSERFADATLAMDFDHVGATWEVFIIP